MRYHCSSSWSLWRWSLLAFAGISGCAAVLGEMDAQAFDLEKRSSACPDTYKSLNGLNFEMHCEQNSPDNDAGSPFIVTDMQECMERCSRFGRNGEGCFGIVFNEDNRNCWIKNSNITAPVDSESITHTAIVPRTYLEPYPTDCPYDDGSVQTLKSGEGYTIHCGKVVNGSDTCWDDYPNSPNCWDKPYMGFYHAQNLSDCMQWCVKTHPLCMAVSYNPDMNIGWANCLPKTSSQSIVDPGANQGVVHSAIVTQFDPIDTTCPANQKYTSGGKQFTISCGQRNAGTNITSIHRTNLTSCMDACVDSNRSCVGVLFDSTLQAGFQNCYLQNSTSTIVNSPNITYAAVAGAASASATSSSTASNKPRPSSSSSKAWVAGPVIGAIAAIGILAGALFWWRRRKHRLASATASGKSASVAPNYQEYQYVHAPMGAPTAPHEMENHPRVEMGTTPLEGPYRTKREGLKGVPGSPQELPT